ncbi:hypothetical protein MNBD_GAMMA24-2533 [hydrothermal vent metagenome]|uniref:Phosphate ABC transporter substrate-binding protein n=1 Tax=hydrothermal vent metagenome TaxID=652676 RepID=A0A3B1BRN3_9ZZZZ
MKRPQNIFSAVLLVILFTVVLPLKADIVVITNKSTKLPGITLNELGRFYLGQRKLFTNGQRVVVADQVTGSAIRQQFYKKVLNMSESELSRYWAKRRFTRKFKPPKIISGDAAMKQWIAMTPDSLGYIDSKSLDSSVKLLLIIP